MPPKRLFHFFDEWGIVDELSRYPSVGDESQNYFFEGYLGDAAAVAEQHALVPVRAADPADVSVPGLRNMVELSEQQKQTLAALLQRMAFVGLITGGTLATIAVGPYLPGVVATAATVAQAANTLTSIPSRLALPQAGAPFIPESLPEVSMGDKDAKPEWAKALKDIADAADNIRVLTGSAAGTYRNVRDAWSYNPAIEHARTVELERARRRQTTAQSIIRSEGANALPSMLKCPFDFQRSPYLDGIGVAHTNNMYEVTYGIDDPLLPELKDVYYRESQPEVTTLDYCRVGTPAPTAGTANGEAVGNSITVRALRVNVRGYTTTAGSMGAFRLIVGFTRLAPAAAAGATATVWPTGFIYLTGTSEFTDWDSSQNQNFRLVLDRQLMACEGSPPISVDMTFPVSTRCTVSAGAYTDWRPFVCTLVHTVGGTFSLYQTDFQVFYSDY